MLEENVNVMTRQSLFGGCVGNTVVCLYFFLFLFGSGDLTSDILLCVVRSPCRIWRIVSSGEQRLACASVYAFLADGSMQDSPLGVRFANNVSALYVPNSSPPRT